METIPNSRCLHWHPKLALITIVTKVLQIYADGTIWQIKCQWMIANGYEHTVSLLRFMGLIYPFMCTADGFLWPAVKKEAQTQTLLLFFISYAEISSTALPETNFCKLMICYMQIYWVFFQVSSLGLIFRLAQYHQFPYKLPLLLFFQPAHPFLGPSLERWTQFIIFCYDSNLFCCWSHWILLRYRYIFTFT